MDFARKQMEKYGWKEGQGLGKNETGVTNALAPKIKNNNNGLGFDISEDFTNNWWNKLYKKASDNVSVTQTSGEVKFSQVGPDSVDIFSVENKFSKKGKKGVEQSFIKTSKIVQGTNIDCGVIPEQTELKIPILTDDELFKACGGRTAHKGARHGLNFSGKLSRIEKQEKILLKQMRRFSLNEDETDKVEKKCKKLEKLKTSDKLDKKDDEKLSKKKKKKKRKAVSFSEAICEVIPEAEADSSFNSEDRLGYESSSTGDPPHPPSPSTPPPIPDLFADISRLHRAVSTGLPDEGIEQDFQPEEASASTSCVSSVNHLHVDLSTDGTKDVNDHRSFEERNYTKANDMRDVIFANLKDSLLSKAEKKLKMRRMRATQKFIVETALLTGNAAEESHNREEQKLTVTKSLEANLKRKKGKLEETDDIGGDEKACKSCSKKSKKEKREEKIVNRIAKGLEKVCKISDTDEKKKKQTVK